MSKTIQVQVPKPCHENWNKMTPTEKGRFCMQCSKEVIDFREMSDQQIAEYFLKATSGVCGRFNNDQLDRNLSQRKHSFPWYKYFIHVLLPAMLVSNRSSAQTPITGDTVICVPQQNINSSIVGQVAVNNENQKQHAIVVKGKITDEELQPIPGVSITIKGANKGWSSDMKGEFKMKVTNEMLPLPVTISSIGFERKEVMLSQGMEEGDTINLSVILMQKATMGLGEVVVVAGYAVAKKKEDKPLFQEIKDSIAKLIVVDTVKVYPNPIHAGAILNLDFNVKAKGNYLAQLINSAGQIVIQKEILLNTKQQVEQLNCNANLTSGIYFVRISNNKTSKIYSSQIRIDQ